MVSTHLHLLDDETLIARTVERDDRDAFGVLLDRHLDRFRAVARRTVHDPHRADDVVQEAVLRMWRHLPAFRRDSRFSTWAHRIVANAARDAVRRERDLLVDPPDRVAVITPEREAVGRDEVARVGSALHALTADQRTALLLVEVEGRSHEEVALLLGTTVSGVKNRVYRARLGLARSLEVRAAS